MSDNDAAAGSRLQPALMALTIAVIVLAATAPAAGPSRVQEPSVYWIYQPEFRRNVLTPARIETPASRLSLAETLMTRLAESDGPWRRIEFRRVFMDADRKLAWVDLAPEPELAAGVMEERLLIWSVVNTLALNMDEVDSVQILVWGGPTADLLGHLDLSRPLRPDRTLIDRAAASREIDYGR
jgi:hypothetical protein